MKALIILFAVAAILMLLVTIEAASGAYDPNSGPSDLELIFMFLQEQHHKYYVWSQLDYSKPIFG